MGQSCRANGALALSAWLVMVAVGALADDGTMPNPDQPVRSSAAGAGEMVSAGIAEGAVGRLVTPSGDPVAGAQITVRSLDRPTGPVPEIAILSDKDGRFAWPLPPGRYRLAAVVEGREIAIATVTVEPGRVTTVTLKLLEDF